MLTRPAETISVNMAKDQFVAVLSHELRSPLSAIVTALQLLRAKGPGSHELDVVERQVGVIVRLVDDLLDVSRMSRGQIELRKERIEIADVVARAIETVDPLLNERRHRLDVLVPRSGLCVCVDPSRMVQVIANLLTNAAKYSERESAISLRAVRDGAQLRLSVEDHGIGIAPEMVPHVFDAFSQASSVVHRARGGLGLGLAIVRTLVELHEGTVTVHSNGLDSGSTFCVQLTVDDDAVVEGERAHSVWRTAMKKSRQTEGNVLTMPRESSTSGTAQSQDVSDSDVARRAYERFLERGSEHGHDLDDWLEAERELRQSAASQVA